MKPNQEIMEEAQELLNDARSLLSDISAKRDAFIAQHEENHSYNIEHGLRPDDEDASRLYHEEIKRLDTATDDLRNAISVVNTLVTTSHVDEDAVRDLEEDISSARNHFDEVGAAPTISEE